MLFPGDRFRLVSWHSRVLQVWRVESNQVVMAARLQSLETSEELSVVTTHLKVIIIIVIVIGVCLAVWVILGYTWFWLAFF